MVLDRKSEEKKLQDIFGFGKFLDDQWKTIRRILNGERILLIEKTGFGKSLCYQYPATQFKGITIIFTPLIALMRDQVKFLESKNISCAAINSHQSEAENSKIINDAVKGKFKILYIAPERQENQEWLMSVKQMHISMVVVDEAHCISVWGHDFRPAYRRIINLVNLLPGSFPVLATTATATKRVEEDIKKQIGHNMNSIRGNLLRNNFHLRVGLVNSEDEKMIWLGQNIPKVEGTGLIYTGTQVSTDMYAKWFQYLGIKSTAYHAGIDPDMRKEIEIGLINNCYKCVVSTNALGMGIDKPDIRFIIHTQVPQSPVHYYQEIGRAGRNGKPVPIVLFFNPYEDLDLPKAFIDSARPKKSAYEKVMRILRKEMLGQNDIMRRANLKKIQVRVILADLIEQKIINEVNENRLKKYEFRYGAPLLNTKMFGQLRRQKLKELRDMNDYIELKDCRMNFLCNYLGDTVYMKCGKCDNDSGRFLKYNFNEEWKRKIEEFRESYFPLLEFDTRGSNLITGVAASYYGNSNTGSVIHKCKYENGGDFPEILLKLTMKAFRWHYGGETFDYLMFVPPTESGNLVKNFAQKLSEHLKIPLSCNLKKNKFTEPQKIFQTSVLKRDNVKNVFSCNNSGEIKGKSILLFDDIYDSGATIKEIGKYLTSLGAKKIAPLVIAKTTGGSIFKDEEKTIN